MKPQISGELCGRTSPTCRHWLSMGNGTSKQCLLYLFLSDFVYSECVPFDTHAAYLFSTVPRISNFSACVWFLPASECSHRSTVPGVHPAWLALALFWFLESWQGACKCFSLHLEPQSTQHNLWEAETHPSGLGLNITLERTFMTNQT